IPGINAPGRIQSRSVPLPPLEPAGPGPVLLPDAAAPTDGVPELIGPSGGGAGTGTGPVVVPGRRPNPTPVESLPSTRSPGRTLTLERLPEPGTPSPNPAAPAPPAGARGPAPGPGRSVTTPPTPRRSPSVFSRFLPGTLSGGRGSSSSG